ncbi:hypothetical protein F4825DRAFT_475850 [Nemania diffusa]|nr:hypothetical protein F4825DRAFT_475850 [Nemania diffusa]
MTELQEEDTLFRIGVTGGEKPHPDRAGVSTDPDVESADPGSPLLFAIQSSRWSVPGALGATPSSCQPRQIPDASLAADEDDNNDDDDDDVSPSPPIESQAQPQSQPKRQPPTLLNIPVEIRLEIYAHLLTAPSNPPPSHPKYPSATSTTVSSSSSSSSTPSPPPPSLSTQTTPSSPLHPSILRTCRQLHAESTPVLYKTNTFLAHTSLLTTFPSFFSPGHPRRRYPPVRSAPLAALVRRYRVRLRLDAEPQFAREDATAQFTGKRELVIEAWQAEWRGAGPDALRLFEGVRAVRAARVTGSTGGFEDYARFSRLWRLDFPFLARSQI